MFFNKETNQNTNNLLQNTTNTPNNLENKTETQSNIDKQNPNKGLIISNIYSQPNSINKFLENNFTQEEEIKSCQNILGFSCKKISKNVIDAFSNKISLGEFYMKNSEDIKQKEKHTKEHKNFFATNISIIKNPINYEYENHPDYDYIETKIKRQKLKEDIYLNQKQRKYVNLNLNQNIKLNSDEQIYTLNKNSRQKIEEFKFNEKLFSESNINHTKKIGKCFNYINEEIFNEKNNNILKLVNIDMNKSSKIFFLFILLL
jgi:hypothetical protein